MLKETAGYIENKLKISKQDKILLAVSGGIDSMVMASLMINLGYTVSIAHCNFALRGKESDKDEDFVKAFAESSGVQFFLKRFRTKEYGRINGLSVQMAARELRYRWFGQLKEENSFTWVAIAHNLNDVYETILLNLTRGTGLKGLTGIKAKSGHIIRPLLFANRESIVVYSSEEKINYREDSSNISIDYKRNRLRHNVLPELKQINPSLDNTLSSTIERLDETYTILNEYVKSVRSRLFSTEDDTPSVLVNDLVSLKPSNTWLFELFKDFNLSPNQLVELKKLFYAESGKYLNTSSHTIYKDRERLLIAEIDASIQGQVRFNNLKELLEFREFTCDILSSEEFKLIKDNAIACLDLNKIEFPLFLRPWKEGDWFYPLGMKGKKKLSDYFTDIKIPLKDKPRIRILSTEEHICWIVGFRIDDRFKISKASDKALIIRQNPRAVL